MLQIKRSVCLLGLAGVFVVSAVAGFDGAAIALADDSRGVSNHTYQRFDSGKADRLIQQAYQVQPTRVIKAQPLIGRRSSKDIRSSNTGSTTLVRAGVSNVNINKKNSNHNHAGKVAAVGPAVRQPTAMVSQKPSRISGVHRNVTSNTNTRSVVDHNARIVRNYQAKYPSATTHVFSSTRHQQTQPVSRHVVRYASNYPSASYSSWPNYSSYGYYSSPSTCYTRRYPSHYSGHYTRHYPSHYSGHHSSHTRVGYHHGSRSSHYGGHIGYSSHGGSHYGFHYGSRSSGSSFRIGVHIGGGGCW